jgi:hypothetical protein
MACKVALSADDRLRRSNPFVPFYFFICLKSRIKTINKIAVNRLTLARKVVVASGFILMLIGFTDNGHHLDIS